MIHDPAAPDWARLRNDVRRLIGRRAPSPADAEDVVQEVLARILRHASSIRDDERFTAWVRRIVDHALVDHLRVRQRHPLLREEPRDETIPAAPAEAPATAPKELLAAVLRPFAEALPSIYRDVILWSELEQIPHAEIASRLGLSVSAVKSRVQRGRVMLRESLTRCCEVGLDVRRAVVSCEVRPDGDLPDGCCKNAMTAETARALQT